MITGLTALIVRLSAWLAPAVQRARFREEWLAEIDRAGHDRPFRTLWRALGAPVDAVALRWHENGANGRTPRGWHRSGATTNTAASLADEIRADIRFALRQLRRSPGVTVVATLTIALGIGASSALFSVVDAAVLRPLSYPDPEQLVTVSMLFERPERETPRSRSLSLGQLQQIETDDDVLSAVVGWTTDPFGRISGDDEAERLIVTWATDGLLALHGLTPAIGRDLTRADSRPDAPEVAVISYGYWQRRFGGDPNVIGRVLRITDSTAIIVGVAPGGYDLKTDLWQPLVRSADAGNRTVSVYGRLRPDVTIAQAEERLSAQFAGQRMPDYDEPIVGVQLSSRLDSASRTYVQSVRTLTGGVAILWLLACVNVAGLLLARGASRQQELAVRASIGASRARLVRQVLTESVVLSVIGGVVGLAVAWLTLDGLVSILPFSLENATIALNREVLFAAMALSGASGLVFGVLPALRLSRVCLSLVLARAGRRDGGALPRRGGQVLIATEVALAVVLVAGAGLMLRSFAQLTAVDLGFNPDGLVTARVLPLDGDGAAHELYFAALAERLRTLPGAEAAGVVDWFALGDGAAYVMVETDAGREQVGWRQVESGYLETLSLPVVAGRVLTAADTDGVVINESAARTLFPDGSAIGQTLVRSLRSGGRAFSVVGVVGDLRHGGPTREVEAEIYAPFDATIWLANYMMAVVRAPNPPADFARELRDAASGIGPRVLVEDIRPASELFGDRVATQRERTLLLSLMGGLGLTLALVGVFGMTAFAVGRRTREIGVRMAFGARPHQVVGTMVGDAAWPIALGTVAGTGLALFATRTIERYLFQTTPTDPGTFMAVAMMLVVTGALAAWLPARRAARVDPVVALRAE